MAYLKRKIKTDLARIRGDYIFNDGGRHKYFKFKKTDDCVVRAIAIVREMDYKKVLHEITDYCLQYGAPFSSKLIIEKYLEATGAIKHKVKHPKGRKARPKDLPNGRWITSMAHHLRAVINKVPHDTWNTSDRMVYTYWGYPKKPKGGEDHEEFRNTQA